MVVLALVLLIIVLVFSVAIVVSNPEVYQLSLFRVLVPVTSAGVYFTGFGAALVTIIAILLLRTGIRRSRETRRRLRSAEHSAATGPADTAEDRSDAGRSDESGPSGTSERSVPSARERESSEDRTTVPVDRDTAEAARDDRDEPRI